MLMQAPDCARLAFEAKRSEVPLAHIGEVRVFTGGHRRFRAAQACSLVGQHAAPEENDPLGQPSLLGGKTVDASEVLPELQKVRSDLSDGFASSIELPRKQPLIPGGQGGWERIGHAARHGRTSGIVSDRTNVRQRFCKAEFSSFGSMTNGYADRRSFTLVPSERPH